MEFTFEEIILATNAKVLKNTLKGGEKFTFSTDTRTIQEGQIYLPLKGENFDGEKFIDKAIDAGAAGYFCTAVKCKMQNANSTLTLQVEDTLVAYLELARFCRRKIAPKTVAITGSSGKTTTKEMAYCVAKEGFITHKSELNFNNEIGLCKTILSMPEDTEVLILEMGMRGLGEIELLSKYSEPDIAIIANVGTAHIGRLGSRENIAKAKCEVTKYLKDDGILIAHEDELIRRHEDKKARSQEDINLSSCPPALMPSVIYFSLDDTKILVRSIGYTQFEYKNHQYELNIEGDYNVQNALAAIEMGLALGMTEAKISQGLKKYSPIEKRWEVQEIKGYKVINDSYNANPESMKGVINTVLDIYSPPLLFVLGDMGELGEDAVKYHQEVGEFIIKNIESSCHCERSEAIQEENGLPRRCDASPRNDVKILTVGTLANEITKVLASKSIASVNFENNLQTSRYILDNIKVGTTIVLKASRSMKFEEIVSNLKEN